MNDEPIPLEDEIYEEEIEVEEETSVTVAMWGEITGDIDNQTDLKEALDAKQNNLTQAQLDAVNSGITSAKVATYDGYPAQITSAVSSEADIRRQADTTLQGNIDAEERARKAADKDIQDVLDGETLARQNADNALGGRIDTEIHDRQVADNGLQSQIDAITSKSDVVDVVANYAALQAYDTSTLGNNDVVKVLDDETHGDAMTYYRWSTTTQTWSYIGQEAPYYTKSQTDTLLLDKQDKIDATHKLSADLVDDTSTTNKFVTAQDKTNWNAKQNALTAGNNIDITNGVISTPAIAPEVVAELPATGTEGNLYLTPKNYTTGTATGNPITISLDEDEGAIDSFQLDGDTAQQTYTGKNLFDSSLTMIQGFVSNTGTIDTNTTSSIMPEEYIPVSADTDYTFSWTPQIAGSCVRNVAFYDGSKACISRVQNANGVNPFNVTTPSGCAYIRFNFYNANGMTPNNPLSTYLTNFQLEKGNTVTSFEPFVGGHPSPSPEFPQQIQTVTGQQTVTVTGKNLFDKNHPNNLKCYVNNNGVLTSGGSQNLSVYIECEPNTTYTVSKSNKGTNNRFCVFNTEAEPAIGVSVISTVGIRVGEDNSSSYTITTGANAHYLGVFYRAGSTTPSESEIRDTIQIEKGSTATTYEPYSSTDYPIDLGSIELCKLGTYQDYIWKDGEDWKVHKETVSVIIDGSENWGASGANTFYVANIYSKIGNSIQSDSTGEMYASHFTIVDISSSNTLVGASLKVDAAQNVSNLRIRLQDMSGGMAGFIQMLSAKKPSIYARRLTPTDITITDQTLIAQLEAVLQAKLQASNTITNTATGTNLAGDMEFDYYEYDPTNRYDKWLWLRANNAYEEFDEEGGGGGGSITVDSALSTTSKNPVQNKVVTAAINSKVDSSSLATVATSGSYNDLSNKPTIPTIPTQTSAFTNNGSDGTSTYVEADELATVATTGAYSDLSGTPTIPTATSDLTNDSGFITSADLPTKTSDLTNDGSDGTSTYVEASGLATVATSGSYNDLSNKPTIPTVNNGTLTIRQNGKTLGTFTANQSTNTTVNLTDNSSYSTSEVKTSATWINGKPIYKKTFSFTLADAESTTINHGISNFGLLIKFEGTVVQSSTKNVPIPRTLTATNYQVGLEGVTDTSFEIDVGSSGPRGKQAYMTLWYTKTTG